MAVRQITITEPKTTTIIVVLGESLGRGGRGGGGGRLGRKTSDDKKI